MSSFLNSGSSLVLGKLHRGGILSRKPRPSVLKSLVTELPGEAAPWIFWLPICHQADINWTTSQRWPPGPETWPRTACSSSYWHKVWGEMSIQPLSLPAFLSEQIWKHEAGRFMLHFCYAVVGSMTPAGSSQAAASSSVWQTLLQWCLGLSCRKRNGMTKEIWKLYQDFGNISFAVDHQMLKNSAFCAKGKGGFMSLQAFHLEDLLWLWCLDGSTKPTHNSDNKMCLGLWQPVCWGLQ